MAVAVAGRDQPVARIAAGEDEATPGIREVFGFDGVEVEMDTAEFVGGEGAGVLDGAG